MPQAECGSAFSLKWRARCPLFSKGKWMTQKITDEMTFDALKPELIAFDGTDVVLTFRGLLFCSVVPCRHQSLWRERHNRLYFKIVIHLRMCHEKKSTMDKVALIIFH